MSSGTAKLVRILIERQCNVNSTNALGQSALHLALQLERAVIVPIVSLLTEHGADPNLRDSFGVTPWHYAVDNVTLPLSLLRI